MKGKKEKKGGEAWEERYIRGASPIERVKPKKRGGGAPPRGGQGA